MPKKNWKNGGESNYYIKCFLKATLNLVKQLEQGDTHFEQEYFLVKNYFNREIVALHPRTKNIITESFSGIVEPFLTGLLRRQFVQDTNIYPEWTHEGKIIILDFPVKDYLEIGLYAMGIFKLLWQQATERRRFRPGIDIPIFLWADEAQLTVSDYDFIYQTTARSAGAATILLSQNISNFYSTLGKNSHAKVDSLLANLSTHIFHCNSDAVTNEWASRSIGKDFRDMMSYGVNSQSSTNSGVSQQLHNQVEPREFTTLRTGAPENDWLVDTVITVAGKTWSDGKNFTRKTFKQLIIS